MKNQNQKTKRRWNEDGSLYRNALAHAMTVCVTGVLLKQKKDIDIGEALVSARNKVDREVEKLLTQTAEEAAQEYKKKIADAIEEAAKNFRCGKCDGAKELGHAMWCSFKSDLKNKLNL